jgi:hypothetical protein
VLNVTNFYVKITAIITESAEMGYVFVRLINGWAKLAISKFVLIIAVITVNAMKTENANAKQVSLEKTVSRLSVRIIVTPKVCVLKVNANVTKASQASTALKKSARVTAVAMESASTVSVIVNLDSLASHAKKKTA